MQQLRDPSEWVRCDPHARPAAACVVTLACSLLQVIGCHAEVVCPELAKAHVRCFKRAVNSKGRESYAACEKEVEAMRRCLRRHKLYPFPAADDLQSAWDRARMPFVRFWQSVRPQAPQQAAAAATAAAAYPAGGAAASSKAN